MKLIKLTISAFGSYAGTQALEMERLGDGGIYLITGDTGAGKTTIFDAVTYALYGEASGDNRDPSMLRSAYAEPDTETFVELVFRYMGKEYTVRRSPEYVRPSKRGGGTALHRAEAQLILPDGRIITKTKEVTSAVCEIIGLDKNQFSRIAMIAQGDFLKLLLASTDERKKIFRQLFGTETFLRLQEKLKSELRTANELYVDIGQQIKRNTAALSCDENKELELLKEEKMPVSESLRIAEDITAKDAAELETLNGLLKKLEEALGSVNIALGKADEAAQNKIKLGETEEKLQKATELLSEKQRLSENEENDRAEARSLDGKAQKLKNELSLYDELEARKKELEDTRKELSEKSVGLEQTKETARASEKELSAGIQEAETLKDCETRREILKNGLAAAEARSGRLEQLEKLHGSWLKSCAELEKLTEGYKKAAEEFDSLNELYKNKHKAFTDEQAGILASGLREGLPCPVCGSLSHPSPAPLSENAPTEAELKELKQRADAAAADQEKAAAAAGAAKGQAQTMKDSFCTQCRELIGSDEPEQIQVEKEKLSDALASLKEQLDGQEAKIKRKEALEKELPRLEAVKAEAEEKTRTLEMAMSSLTAQLSEKESMIGALSERLEFSGKAQAQSQIEKYENKAAAILSALEASQNEKKQLEESVNLLTGQKKALEERLSECDDTDRQALLDEKDALNSEKELLSGRLSAVTVRLARNTEAKNELSELLARLSEAEHRLGYVKALSDTANGTLSGKEKIMLETYVQTTYLDRILIRANTRFMILSGGQYELVRRREAENNKSQSGLELNVTDHYSGSERSVKSLSGGEAFKASLALALGLSDEIQSSAGGISLDTMFIDEGFGTLDDESLKQAIKVLNSLSEGNKLVGIISHVPELKEKIEKQIVITKDRTGGSTAKIVI